MNVEVLLWIIGVLFTGFIFWLKDWKSKIENKTQEIEKINNEFSNIMRERLHQCELGLSRRITRDEIEAIKHEIKNDFHTFKRELYTMIKGE